jgi:K+-transporting ATPase KdpF subunit
MKMIMIALAFNAINSESLQKASDNESMAYLTGIIIAVFILGYLVYSLLKPEKF